MLRRIRLKRVESITVRSKLQKDGILGSPKFELVIQERKRSRSKIFKNYLDIPEQIVTGNQIYAAIRENYKTFYRKQDIDIQVSQIGRNLIYKNRRISVVNLAKKKSGSTTLNEGGLSSRRGRYWGKMVQK